VYLFGVGATEATAYSLFIVGLTALIGSFAFMKKRQVDFRTAAVFGVPSILAVYLVRGYVMPIIPANLGPLGSLDITRDKALLVLFGALMLATAFSMIRAKSTPEEDETPVQPEFKYGKILLEGLLVGSVTGLVGAGGGFLIIPALVLLAKLPMKRAVGTSLLIIAAKSLIGFTGDLQTNPHIQWPLLLTVAGLATVGIIIGSLLGQRISGAKLKPAFGWFVLVMGLFMVGKEVATPAPTPGEKAPAVSAH
jgi:hypothetical protein